MHKERVEGKKNDAEDAVIHQIPNYSGPTF
jgi:hypothetical protein